MSARATTGRISLLMFRSIRPGTCIRQQQSSRTALLHAHPNTHAHVHTQGVFSRHASPSFLTTRSLHASPQTFRNQPSSWGDLIPQPKDGASSSSKAHSLQQLLGRPQYKRFGQNSGSSGRSSIFLDKRYQALAGVVAVGAGGYYVTHLETVPMSGRRRFLDVSPEQEESMAKDAYNQTMKQYRHRLLPSNHPDTRLVERVARRIIKAAGMENLEWEFHVIDDPEKNAFVLPGGKVFVFTGILPIAANEAGLATVLGHEIAHQLARHSAEKLSFAKIVIFASVIFAWAFDPSYMIQRLVMDLGMMLPFSRKCESEADRMGLQLMAQACFDPRESVKMWSRMAASEKGFNLAFLNTHPASKDRMQKLEQWMPEAIDTANKSDCATTSAYADMFNKANLAYW